MSIQYSSFAANPKDAKRLKKIASHPYRNEFQRDRDRILYSKEFRRLSGKTQVFVTSFDDNVRTRLTHTLEVCQIACTIAKELELNTELTEAIAYGHDVGHTPFGHIGERTLNFIMNGCFRYFGYNSILKDEEKGFKHNLQSVRVVVKLENDLEEDDTAGLNLTRYTLWGLAHHSKLEYKSCDYYLTNPKLCRYKNSNMKCDGKLSVGFYKTDLTYNSQPILENEKDWTFEAIVVAYADEISQRHHDIEDGIYAGIINIDELLEEIEETFKFDDTTKSKIDEIKKKNEVLSKMKALSKFIVDYYTTKYIEVFKCIFSKLESGKFEGHTDIKIANAEDFKKNKAIIYNILFGENDKNYIDKVLDEEINDSFYQKDKHFQGYLCDNILLSELAQSMDGKASYIIRQLVKAYLTNPQQLPDKTIISIITDFQKILEDTNQKDLLIHYKLMKNSCKPDKQKMIQSSKARKTLDTILRNDDERIKGLLLRRICDYIAGMTDQYAIKQYQKLYEVYDIFKTSIID